jgi:hypothetical protein
MSKIEGPIGVPFKESDNYVQGKTGAQTPQKMGPAVGKVSGNPVSSGGVNRGTKPSGASGDFGGGGRL